MAKVPRRRIGARLTTRAMLAPPFRAVPGTSTRTRGAKKLPDAKEEQSCHRHLRRLKIPRLPVVGAATRLNRHLTTSTTTTTTMTTQAAAAAAVVAPTTITSRYRRRSHATSFPLSTRLITVRPVARRAASARPAAIAPTASACGARTLKCASNETPIW